ASLDGGGAARQAGHDRWLRFERVARPLAGADLSQKRQLKVKPQRKLDLARGSRSADSMAEERRGHGPDIVPVLHSVQQILEISTNCHCRSSVLPVGSELRLGEVINAVPAVIACPGVGRRFF